MIPETGTSPHPFRPDFARFLGWAERAAYFGVGLLLTGGIVHLLAATAGTVATALLRREAPEFYPVLDKLLLVLILVEVLHTIRVSLGEDGSLACENCHHRVLEPFLVVGVIASVRQLLKLTLESAELLKGDPARFPLVLAELGIHGALIFLLVLGVWLLRHRASRRG